jgi:hypothetical protein
MGEIGTGSEMSASRHSDWPSKISETGQGYTMRTAITDLADPPQCCGSRVSRDAQMIPLLLNVAPEVRETREQ